MNELEDKSAAVLLCGHGSRDIEAVSEFKNLTSKISEKLPKIKVTHGFLEFARPTISEQLEVLRKSGVTKVIALPGMLFAAGHAKNDIPSVLNGYQTQNKEFSIEYGRELAIDLKLLECAQERIIAAEAAAKNLIPRDQTMLIVVGRGTNDPDANSNVSKVTRMLWEGMGFAWAETFYSGVTKPLITEELDRATLLGFKQIIIFPYFLFTGVLIKRIYKAADTLATNYPNINVLKAGYFKDHPLVVNCFLERLEEIDVGKNVMNCQLCKYREQVIGYEQDQGAPQMGHHHHVEGIGTDADHDHIHHTHHRHKKNV